MVTTQHHLVVPVFAALALCACPTVKAPVCEMPTGLPAFPGAEGYGSTTPGGRGGTVIEVTTLANSGAGSLREAISTKGPRIIVFRVAGIIAVTEPLDIREPFVTIAGQTAPGDGVLINGAGMVIFTHDVILQHLRLRPGNFGPVKGEDNDALAILGSAASPDDGSNIIVDHVSMGWSEDEVFSTYGGAHHVTVQWSMLSEGLKSPRHNKGAHSAGLLFGAGSQCASVHHTLMAHNGFRNPLLQGAGRFDVVNNVIFDWEETGTELQPFLYRSEANIIRNVYIAGPSTNPHQRPLNMGASHPVNHLIKAETIYGSNVAHLFAQGNIGPFREQDQGDEYSFAALGYGDTDFPKEGREAQKFETPLVTTVATADVQALVLANAGATKPVRDAIDARVVQETKDKSGRIPASVTDVGGFPTIADATAPTDSDHDGMPDSWEASQGLNANDANDGSADADGDGYTNVEEFLHSLR